MDELTHVPLEIYQRLTTSSDYRQLRHDKTVFTDRESLKLKLRAVYQRIALNRKMWSRSTIKNDVERAEYESDQAACENKIAELMSEADRAIIDRLSDGLDVGIGYSNPSDNHPLIIPPQYWHFLEMDFEGGKATGQGLHFAGVRFMKWQKIKEEMDQFYLTLDTSERDHNIDTHKTESEISNNEKTPLRRDQQIFKILEIIEQKGFDPMNVPKGWKAKIETECLKHGRLFTKDGFKKAWQEARNRKLIDVEDPDQYR